MAGTMAVRTQTQFKYARMQDRTTTMLFSVAIHQSGHRNCVLYVSSDSEVAKCNDAQKVGWMEADNEGTSCPQTIDDAAMLHYRVKAVQVTDDKPQPGPYQLRLCLLYITCKRYWQPYCDRKGRYC